MNVALQRPLSAVDLNFNPAQFPLGQLMDFVREHWGLEGEFTPLDGERDQNHRLTAANGTTHVLKVSAAGESEGAVEFQVAALRHLERHASDLPVPRIIASKAGKDLEWITAADGTRHMVRLLSWIPGTPLSRGEPLRPAALRNAAAFQARLARGLQGFFHPHARHFVAWDIQRALLMEPGVQAWVAEDAKTLCADLNARLQRELLPRLAGLRAQVVHSDGHADNLLRMGPDTDEIVGVIDFGDMVHAPLVQDLAVIVASFARHGDMSLDNAVAQVESWNGVLPLTDEELAVLHDLTLLRLATALCLYDFRTHATEKPPAWLTEERPDIVRALSRFLALDRAEVHERYRAACGRVGRAPAHVDIAGLRERRSRTLGPSYRLFYDRPVHLVRGEGTWLYDADGRRYLDCYNNVASVGHCHPHVVAALSRQAATLNTHTRYLHDNVVRYAERLAATMPEKLRVCYFVCTGTEANDLAIRIARVASGQEGVIVSDDSYHGNSNVVGAASTSMYPKSEQPEWLATVPPPNGYRGEYRYGTPDIGPKYAAHIDTAIAKLQNSGHGAAVWLCDIIFDSNGTILPPPGYLEYTARAIHAAGGLFIADEVQSGFYRTGERDVGIPLRGCRARHRHARQADRRWPSGRRGDHDACHRGEVRGEVLVFQHLWRKPGFRRGRHGRARCAGARRRATERDRRRPGVGVRTREARREASAGRGRARQGAVLGARNRTRPRDACAGGCGCRPDHEPAARGRIPARAHGRFRQRDQDPPAARFHAG